jgi:CheY-like chemotaxis protein
MAAETARHREIPVILIMTSGVRSEELERAYALGANSVLVPATVEELLESGRAIR